MTGIDFLKSKGLRVPTGRNGEVEPVLLCEMGDPPAGGLSEMRRLIGMVALERVEALAAEVAYLRAHRAWTEEYLDRADGDREEFEQWRAANPLPKPPPSVLP